MSYDQASNRAHPTTRVSGLNNRETENRARVIEQDAFDLLTGLMHPGDTTDPDRLVERALAVSEAYQRMLEGRRRR